MNRFRSGPAQSPFRQAEAYWTALRRNGGVPRRSDLDPRGLGGLLEHAFVLERVAPGLARFRLAGRHLNALAGMDIRGIPVSAFLEAGSRARLSSLLCEVFDTPAIAELALESRSSSNVAVKARMILLPMADDEGAICRALGVLVADPAPGCGPLQFVISDSLLKPVGARATFEQGPDARQPGFAEPAGPALPRAPRLRVVK